MSSPRKRGPITTAYRGDAGTRSSRAIQLLFLSFRGAPLRANPESISPTPRWIPGSRNARPGMTADSIAQMAATFRDGDTRPHILKRAYVRHVLVVRGASRGRFEAEQDAAPARVSRTHVAREAGVSVRANYVALPSMAGRGQARTRRKPPDRGVKASVLSRKNAPLAQNRRQWSAVRRRAFGQHHRFARDAGSETLSHAPYGAPCPPV